MPFDGKMLEGPMLKRAVLVDALRHLPSTHTWDFHESGGRTQCGSYGCAVGLAFSMGLIKEPYCCNLFDALGFDNAMGMRLFDAFGEENSYGVPTSEVTPLMVADAIEKA